MKDLEKAKELAYLEAGANAYFGNGFNADANHILNSGDYIKRSEVVEAIEGIEYNPKDMEFEYYWHLTLAEILTKFKTK